MGRRKKNPETIAAVPPTNVEKLLTEAEAQIHDQQERIRRKDAIFYLVLKKMPVRVFEYDTVSDTMYYTWLNAKEEQEYRTIEHFRAYLLNRNGDNPEKQESLRRLFDGDFKLGGQGTAEFCARFWQDEYRWYRATYRRLEEENGGAFVVGYTEDINAEVLAHRQLVDTAQRDPLTKLYNREATEKLVNDEILSLRPGEKGVLLYLDIDDFKQVNSRFGHMSGDGYLRAVTETLRSDFRDVDIFGRMGGDEFLVFFKGFLSIDVIEKRAQHIVDLFIHVQIENFSAISCSMGVSVTGSREDSFETLLPKAEKALKDAKRRGKNRYRMYDDEHY